MEIEGAPARDALFHEPVYQNPDWVETNWWTFLIPERNMRGHIYVGFRSNVGVVMSLIAIWSRDCDSLIETDYYDHRVHLPMPLANLDDFQLANGLHVQMPEANQKWIIRYEGFQGTTLELEIDGMMPMVSSHATRLPEGADFSHFHQVASPLAGVSDHLDQTQMMRGELNLRGERIEISFPSNGDHSWGPRPEFGHGCGYFDEGYFGEEFAFHVQTKNKVLATGPVTNGYILDHGEVIGLKAGIGHYEHDGWYTKRVVYDLEDVRGKSYRIEGTPTSRFILPTWPNQFNIARMARWHYEGEEGWGEYKWQWETSDIQANGGTSPPADLRIGE